jgi:phage repressor protein C with HTH and peptisase S24 domain
MRKPRKRERVYVPNERLIAARERLYASAADAARAMGVPEPTYQAHENGSRGLGRSAKRYAAFFRVTTDWLLGRTAPMRGNQLVIPLTGRVGAGSRVEYEHDVAELAKGDTIALPGDREIKALVVQGDSQLPRYRDGEIVLYDARPVTPGDLVGQFAIVDTYDGRRLIKLLRRGFGDNRWNLESLGINETEEGVELIGGAYRVLGTLTGR